ncbi:MAG: ABC transporter permease, partial [Alphaproteobacteria bacterium]|nr:ABC transporter permease [Alphaproteobacteria bacterium]
MAVVADTTLAIPPRRKRGPVLHFIGRLFREKPLGAAGAVVFVLFLFCGIFADLLAPYGMNQIAPLKRLRPPSLDFPFGTDNLGRDMLSRCLYGAQLSVIIGFCAAGLATIISIVLGVVSG